MSRLKAFLGLSLFLGSFAMATEPKASYWVDVRKALAETKDGKKAMVELEAEFKAHRAGLEKQEKEILKHQEDFTKKKSVLTDSALQEKQDALRTEIAKFQQELQKSQIQFQQRQQETLKPIVERLQKVIEKIAVTKGIPFVHQRNENLIYASPDLDLTEEVVRTFNRG